MKQCCSSPGHERSVEAPAAAAVAAGLTNSHSCLLKAGHVGEFTLPGAGQQLCNTWSRGAVMHSNGILGLCRPDLVQIIQLLMPILLH